jgi:penicillin amidase
MGACLDAVASTFGVAADGSTSSPVPLWGSPDAHQAVFAHQVLGQSPLACLADRSIAHGGDYTTVNVGPFSFDADGAWAQGAGPSYRQIVDLSALDSSLFINPMGQDGNEFSDEYDNLLPMWAAGTYLGMLSGAADVAAATTSTQTFYPAAN